MIRNISAMNVLNKYISWSHLEKRDNQEYWLSIITIWNNCNYKYTSLPVHLCKIDYTFTADSWIFVLTITNLNIIVFKTCQDIFVTWYFFRLTSLDFFLGCIQFVKTIKEPQRLILTKFLSIASYKRIFALGWDWLISSLYQVRCL